jgi:hypothetical protein
VVVVVDDRELALLAALEDLVRVLEAHAQLGGDEIGALGHDLAERLVARGFAEVDVSRRDDAQEDTTELTIFGDGYTSETVLFFYVEYVANLRGEK